MDTSTGGLLSRSIVLRSPRIERANFEYLEVSSEATLVRSKGSTKGTMVEAVRDAFLKKWCDDTPAGMSRKEIDPIIREHLGYPRDGIKPSSRTIGEGISLARAEIAKRRS